MSSHTLMEPQHLLVKIHQHQLDQMAPLVFKFKGEKLYDRNIWRGIVQMNRFNPETQWKFIIDLEITELYDQLPIKNKVLGHLGFKNRRQLVALLIKKDTNKCLDLGCGLAWACYGGHRDLAQFMIDLGADEWNRGLESACEGGHHEIVQWMMDLGATHWNLGLCGACCGGHRDLAQWMIDMGARNWDHGLKFACLGGHQEMARWMIELGARDWDNGLLGACWGGHQELAQMMIERGATNTSLFKKYFPPHQ